MAHNNRRTELVTSKYSEETELGLILARLDRGTSVGIPYHLRRVDTTLIHVFKRSTLRRAERH